MIFKDYLLRPHWSRNASQLNGNASFKNKFSYHTFRVA